MALTWVPEINLIGPPGPAGPPGVTTLRGAADYDETTAPEEGSRILWVPSAGKYAPRIVAPAGISPGSVANIGPRDGQNHFLLQTARDGAPAFEQHSQNAMAAGWELAPYATVSADKTAVVSRVSVGAPTTGGSTFPRTEWRECGLDGLPIGFDALTGIHRLIFDFRVLASPTTGRDIVVGQWHNGDTDRLAIRAQDVSGTRRGRLRMNGTSVYEFANPLVLGTWYRCMTEAINNTVNVYFAADGQPFPGTPQYTLASAFTATAGGATWYQKWGCYLQTSTATDAATDYGLVEHRNISHWHTGWPTPAKYYAVPGHAGAHALGGQDDLSGLFVPWANVGVAGGVASLDPAGRQLPSQEPLVSSTIRAGSVAASLTSDASAGGNLINLAITGNAVINPPTNPTDFQGLRYHCVAQGAARSVTFGSGVLPSTGVGLGPYNLTRGQVLVALLEYVGNKATTADAAAPAWGLLAATIVG